MMMQRNFVIILQHYMSESVDGANVNDTKTLRGIGASSAQMGMITHK